MSKLNEHQGLSEDQIKSVRTVRTALKASMDYCRPQFTKAIGLYRLWAGIMPPEIETTFSQIMLWFAYAAVDQELTYAMRQMMKEPDWLTLVAQEVQYERTSDMATKWLRYQMEERQQFQRFAIPPIQASYIFGNGYRWYRYAKNQKTKYRTVMNMGLMGMPDPQNPFTTIEETVTEGCISATNPNFFNILPSPSGHEINTPEELSEERLDYLLAQFYPKKKWIESLAQQGTFNKGQVALLFNQSKHGSETEDDPTVEFKQAIVDENGAWKNFSMPDWVRQMNNEVDNTDMDPRFRVVVMFEPDRWRFVANDRYLLYDGKPWINCTPIANFKANQTQSEFFSVGIIEPIQDLILSMIMNFDMRMDHLITKFHPTKYLPQALVDAVGGDLSRFDTKPYNHIAYPHNLFRGGLEGYMFTESGEDLSNQAFLEQGQMKEYLEDIISQRGGRGLQNSTATVGSALVNEDVARSMLRAMTVDMTGIRDSAEITLKFGAKYITEDPLVRTGAGGLNWEAIEFDAITDGYGVKISGARNLAMAEEVFKKQLSVLPFLANDPQLRGQLELKRQVIKAGQFDNPDAIINGDSGAPRSPAEMLMAQPRGESSMPGGVPSFQNDAQSMMNNGSDLTAAGAAAV